MNILTAIKKAIDEDSFIARTSLDFGEGRTLIKPTDSSDCCIVVFRRDSSKKTAANQMLDPTADDLWLRIGKSKDEFRNKICDA